MKFSIISWLPSVLVIGCVGLLASCAQVTASQTTATNIMAQPPAQSVADPTDLTLEVNPYEIEESFSTRELQDEINAIERQRDADRLSNYLDRIQNLPSPTRLPK